MFNRPKIDVTMIDTTSKIALKLSCLQACGNEIEQAQKLYDFIASDLPHLPDVAPEKPSGFEKVRRSADELFAWVNTHQEDISRGIGLVQSFRSKTPIATAVTENVPPIPKI